MKKWLWKVTHHNNLAQSNRHDHWVFFLQLKGEKEKKEKKALFCLQNRLQINCQNLNTGLPYLRAIQHYFKGSPSIQTKGKTGFGYVIYIKAHQNSREDNKCNANDLTTLHTYLASFFFRVVVLIIFRQSPQASVGILFVLLKVHTWIAACCSHLLLCLVGYQIGFMIIDIDGLIDIAMPDWPWINLVGWEQLPLQREK